MAHVAEYASNQLTPGEETALKELRKLPKEWLIVTNRLVTLPSGYTRELDFVIIGQKNVFLIEEKSWQGHFKGNESYWSSELGEPRKSPLIQAETNAKALRGNLDKAINGLSSAKYFLHPLVLMTKATKPPAITNDPKAKNILLLPTVNSRLLAMDSDRGDLEMGFRRHDIWEWLIGLKERPKLPKTIGPYSLGDQIDHKPENGTKIFNATNALGKRRILKIHELGHPLALPRSFYENEWLALDRLSSTQLVPQVHDPIYHDDLNLIVLPSDPAEGTPLSDVEHPTSRDGLVQELKLMRSAFNSMAAIHTAGVIHRGLTPLSLYTEKAGDEWSVTFTNFESARLPIDNTISVILDDLQIVDPYAAPELKAGYGRATPKADAYSLALIFLERMSGQAAFELIREGAVMPSLGGFEGEKDDLWSSVENVFYRCISPDERARPTAEECVTLLTHALDIIQNSRDGTSESDRGDDDNRPDITIESRPVKSILEIAANTLGTDETQFTLVPGTFQKVQSTIWLNPEPTNPSTWIRVPYGGATIGRAPENYVVFNQPQVSRYHAKIEKLEQGYVLIDVGSTSGTSVGSETIQAFPLTESITASLARIPMAIKVIEIPNVGETFSGVIHEFEGTPHLSEVLLIRPDLSHHTTAVYAIGPSGATLGRAPDNDIILPDKLISNYHARITYEIDGYYIEDLTSTNGTFINNERQNLYKLSTGPHNFGTGDVAHNTFPVRIANVDLAIHHFMLVIN